MVKFNYISSLSGAFEVSGASTLAGLLMLSGICVLSGCVKENIPQSPLEVRHTVWLSSSKPQLSDNQEETTKTHWTGETIFWSEGDSVKVAAKGDGSWLSEDGSPAASGSIVKSESAAEEDCAITRFSVPSGFLDTSHDNRQFFAVYPASCVTGTCTTSGDAIPVRIPQVQIPVRNASVRSYDPSADLLVGKTAVIQDPAEGETYQMLWDRAVAHLDLNFLNIPDVTAGEKLISILIRSDQPLVNNFSLSTDGMLALPQTPGTDNVLTVLQRSSNIVIDSDASIRDVWLCVRPCTVSELSIEILTDKAVYVKSWSGISRTFSRNRRNIMNVNMKGAERKAISTSESGNDFKTIYDLSFDVDIPEVKIWSTGETGDSYTFNSTPASVKKAIDLHIEVLPIYVFGNESYSGDYYGISGYCVLHNGNFYKTVERYHIGNYSLDAYYWYMSEYNLEFQLLSADGQPVSNDNTEFFITPEPSTTMSTTTYKKGFKFSLSPKLTIGSRQKEDKQTQELSWKNFLMGFIGFGFSWDNSSTQNLPDQEVNMVTGIETRNVSYKMLTNNDENGFGTSYIPTVARTDQRMDFSLVWHLKSGNFCANDNDFGNMVLQACITPVYKSAAYAINSKTAAVRKARVRYSHPAISATLDLPGMNRIPAGNVKLKNTTRNTLTNILFYRSGEYGIKSPYCSPGGAYNQNEEADILLREGEYDIVYELVDPDSLEPKGHYMIKGVKITADSTAETSTTHSIAL